MFFEDKQPKSKKLKTLGRSNPNKQNNDNVILESGAPIYLALSEYGSGGFWHYRSNYPY